MSHKLAIITVVYENYSILKDFIKSLDNQKNKNFHVYIADLSKNKQKIEMDNISYSVIEGNNLGYSHGINLCLKKAVDDGIDKYCVINNDTYFNNDFIDNVFKAMQKHPSSLIGGKIYYAPGFEYHKDRYSPNDLGKVIWFTGGKIDWNHALTHHIGVDEVDEGKYDKLSPTEFITGCLICFSKEVYDKVGSWEEDYFMYYEDADYCERAKRKNIALLYAPSIVIWHKNAQSTMGSGSKFHQKYQNINRMKFGLKYAPLWTKLHLIKNYVISYFTK